MKILFVHQNFPAQHLHLASRLAAIPCNEVFLSRNGKMRRCPGVRNIIY